ncbi:hypothetical protein OIU77_025058 [Salix suchowensis]|nr:hypothetical protein OIU77_025058 [Salix suchowensis]
MITSYEDVNRALCESVMGFEKGHESAVDMVERKRARHTSEREVGLVVAMVVVESGGAGYSCVEVEVIRDRSLGTIERLYCIYRDANEESTTGKDMHMGEKVKDL